MREIAEATHRAESTVRELLKRIHVKLDVSRRADLVRMVLALAGKPVFAAGGTVRLPEGVAAPLVNRLEHLVRVWKVLVAPDDLAQPTDKPLYRRTVEVFVASHR